MVFFIDKPSIPPTPAADAPVPVINFMDGFRLMKSNINFGLIVVIFAIKQGALTSFGMLIANILEPFGYSPEQLAQVGLALLLSGIFGALITTIVVDRTRIYKTTLIVLCVGVISSTIGFI